MGWSIRRGQGRRAEACQGLRALVAASRSGCAAAASAVSADGPADESALRYAGHLDARTPVRAAGEQPCITSGHRVWCGTVCDDAEHHGDRNDGDGVVGGTTAKLFFF